LDMYVARLQQVREFLCPIQVHNALLWQLHAPRGLEGCKGGSTCLPDVIRPMVPADCDPVAAFVIRAIDQETANPSGAHLGEGDLLAGRFGHAATPCCKKRKRPTKRPTSPDAQKLKLLISFANRTGKKWLGPARERQYFQWLAPVSLILSNVRPIYAARCLWQRMGSGT
jgi:hypothetical protein